MVIKLKSGKISLNVLKFIIIIVVVVVIIIIIINLKDQTNLSVHFSWVYCEFIMAYMWLLFRFNP